MNGFVVHHFPGNSVAKIFENSQKLHWIFRNYYKILSYILKKPCLEYFIRHRNAQKVTDKAIDLAIGWYFEVFAFLFSIGLTV